MNPHDRILPPEYLAAQMGWVRALARNLVRDPSEADDVSQDVWLAAAQGPPESAANPRAWLAIVTRHIAQARGRSESRRRRREQLASRLERGEPNEDVLARGEACQQLVAAVMALDEPYRSTVLRRYLDGLSAAEIAAQDGIGLPAVRKRLSRAMQQLRAELDTKFEGGRSAWLAVLVDVGRGGRFGAALGGLVLMKKFVMLAAALVLLVCALLFAPNVREWLGATGDRSAPNPSALSSTPSQAAGLEAPAEAQGTRADLEPPAKPATLRLAGIVVDLPYPDASLPSTPAAGVQVLYSVPSLDVPFPHGEVRSGPDGRFAIEVEDPGRRPLLVLISAEGNENYRPGSTALQLEAGAKIDEQRLERAAHGDLHGIVVDGEDRPLAGVAVQLENPDGMSEAQQPEAQVRTDAAGAFAFRSLHGPTGFRSGTPTLVPIKPGFRALPSKPPSALRSGGWGDVHLRMLETGGTLIVHVRDEDGRPEFGARIGVTVSKGEPGAHWEPYDFHPDAAPFHGQTDAAGSAVFGGLWIGKRLEVGILTQRGGWTIERAIAGRADVRNPLSGSAIVVGAATPFELQIVLPDKLRLRGRVVDPSGAGVAKANVNLRPRNGNREALWYPTAVQADVNGTFEQELLRPAHAFPLEISVYSGPFAMGPLESMQKREGRLVARQLLEISPESPDEIQIEVQAQPDLTITGTVREKDGSPCAGQIVAIPAGACAGDYARGSAVWIDEEGRFEFACLLPGNYDLEVRPTKSTVFTDCLLKTRFPGIAAGASGVALVLGESPAVNVEIEVQAAEGTPKSMVLVTGFHYPYVARDPSAHGAESKQSFTGLAGWPKGAILNFGGQTGSSDAEGMNGFLHQVAAVPLHTLPPMNPGWYWFGVDATDDTGQRYHACGTGLVYLAPGSYRFHFDLVRQTRVEGRISNLGERDELCVGLVTPAGRAVQLTRTNLHLDEVVSIGAGGRFELEGAPVGEFLLRVGSEAQLRAGEFVAEVPLTIAAGENARFEIRLP